MEESLRNFTWVIQLKVSQRKAEKVFDYLHTYGMANKNFKFKILLRKKL